MKQILIQLDDSVAAQLERIAPGRNHRRSQFLRKVIARAVQEELEARTRAAYEKWPDDVPSVDASEWASEDEALHPTKPARAARSRRKVKR